jgi:hypothetical protein
MQLTEIEKAFQFMYEEEERLKLHPRRDQWRVHYDSSGKITDIQDGPPFVELPDPYIQATKEQVIEETTVQHRVINGQLVKIDLGPISVVKLVESESGQYLALDTDMSILIEQHEQHGSTKRYGHMTHS